MSTYGLTPKRDYKKRRAEGSLAGIVVGLVIVTALAVVAYTSIKGTTDSTFDEIKLQNQAAALEEERQDIVDQGGANTWLNLSADAFLAEVYSSICEGDFSSSTKKETKNLNIDGCHKTVNFYQCGNSDSNLYVGAVPGTTNTDNVKLPQAYPCIISEDASAEITCNVPEVYAVADENVARQVLIFASKKGSQFEYYTGQVDAEGTLVAECTCESIAPYFEKNANDNECKCMSSSNNKFKSIVDTSWDKSYYYDETKGFAYSCREVCPQYAVGKSIKGEIPVSCECSLEGLIHDDQFDLPVEGGSTLRDFLLSDGEGSGVKFNVNGCSSGDYENCGCYSSCGDGAINLAYQKCSKYVSDSEEYNNCIKNATEVYAKEICSKYASGSEEYNKCINNVNDDTLLFANCGCENDKLKYKIKGVQNKAVCVCDLAHTKTWLGEHSSDYSDYIFVDDVEHGCIKQCGDVSVDGSTTVKVKSVPNTERNACECPQGLSPVEDAGGVLIGCTCLGDKQYINGECKCPGELVETDTTNHKCGCPSGKGLKQVGIECKCEDGLDTVRSGADIECHCKSSNYVKDKVSSTGAFQGCECFDGFVQKPLAAGEPAYTAYNLVCQCNTARSPSLVPHVIDKTTDTYTDNDYACECPDPVSDKTEYDNLINHLGDNWIFDKDAEACASECGANQKAYANHTECHCDSSKNLKDVISGDTITCACFNGFEPTDEPNDKGEFECACLTAYHTEANNPDAEDNVYTDNDKICRCFTTDEFKANKDKVKDKFIKFVDAIKDETGSDPRLIYTGDEDDKYDTYVCMKSCEILYPDTTQTACACPAAGSEEETAFKESLVGSEFEYDISNSANGCKKPCTQGLFYQKSGNEYKCLCPSEELGDPYNEIIESLANKPNWVYDAGVTSGDYICTSECRAPKTADRDHVSCYCPDTPPEGYKERMDDGRIWTPIENAFDCFECPSVLDNSNVNMIVAVKDKDDENKLIGCKCPAKAEFGENGEYSGYIGLNEVPFEDDDERTNLQKIDLRCKECNPKYEEYLVNPNPTDITKRDCACKNLADVDGYGVENPDYILATTKGWQWNKTIEGCHECLGTNNGKDATLSDTTKELFRYRGKVTKDDGTVTDYSQDANLKLIELVENTDETCSCPTVEPAGYLSEEEKTYMVYDKDGIANGCKKCKLSGSSMEDECACPDSLTPEQLKPGTVVGTDKTKECLQCKTVTNSTNEKTLTLVENGDITEQGCKCPDASSDVYNTYLAEGERAYTADDDISEADKIAHGCRVCEGGICGDCAETPEEQKVDGVNVYTSAQITQIKSTGATWDRSVPGCWACPEVQNIQTLPITDKDRNFIGCACPDELDLKEGYEERSVNKIEYTDSEGTKTLDAPKKVGEGTDAYFVCKACKNVLNQDFDYEMNETTYTCSCPAEQPNTFVKKSYEYYDVTGGAACKNECPSLGTYEDKEGVEQGIYYLVPELKADPETGYDCKCPADVLTAISNITSDNPGVSEDKLKEILEGYNLAGFNQNASNPNLKYNASNEAIAKWDASAQDNKCMSACPTSDECKARTDGYTLWDPINCRCAKNNCPEGVLNCPQKCPDGYIAIYDTQTLQAIGNHPNYPSSGNYCVTNDIEVKLSDITDPYLLNELKGATEFIPLTHGAIEGKAYTGEFTGKFEGNNYTISKLNITNGSVILNVGLFSYIGEKGEVKNVKIADSNINVGCAASVYDSVVSDSKTATYAGMLAGVNKGTVTNIHVTGGSVSACYAGGLVGVNANSVTGSSVTGTTVDAVTCAGGFVSMNDSAISGSYVQGLTVKAPTRDAGGFVCQNTGTIETSFVHNGSVTAPSVGGFAWTTSNAIKRAFVKGTTVETENVLAGFVVNAGGTIENCYSNTILSGRDGAGFFKYGIVNLKNIYAVTKLKGTHTDISGFGSYVADTEKYAESQNIYWAASVGITDPATGKESLQDISKQACNGATPCQYFNSRTMSAMKHTPSVDVYNTWNKDNAITDDASAWNFYCSDYPSLKGMPLVKDNDHPNGYDVQTSATPATDACPFCEDRNCPGNKSVAEENKDPSCPCSCDDAKIDDFLNKSNTNNNIWYKKDKSATAVFPDLCVSCGEYEITDGEAVQTSSKVVYGKITVKGQDVCGCQASNKFPSGYFDGYDYVQGNPVDHISDFTCRKPYGECKCEDGQAMVPNNQGKCICLDRMGDDTCPKDATYIAVPGNDAAYMAFLNEQIEERNANITDESKKITLEDIPTTEEVLMYIGNEAAYPRDEKYCLLGNAKLRNSKYNGLVLVNPGKNSVPASFNGIFDGGNFTLSDINLSKDFTNLGLFTATGSNSIIRDLNVSGQLCCNSIYVDSTCGLLVGSNSGNITNVSANVKTVVSSIGAAGGLVGTNDGSITNSSVDINSYVKGYASAGGLVGINSSNVESSYVYGRGENSLVEKYTNAVCPGNSDCSIDDATRYAGINGGAGGFVGTNSGNIDKSFAYGVEAKAVAAGGFAGLANSGEINQCFVDNIKVTGTVDTNNNGFAGGFVGVSGGLKIRDAYVLRLTFGEVASTITNTGFVGSQSGNMDITNIYTVPNIGEVQKVAGFISVVGNLNNSFKVTNSYLAILDKDNKDVAKDVCLDIEKCFANDLYLVNDIQLKVHPNDDVYNEWIKVTGTGDDAVTTTVWNFFCGDYPSLKDMPKRNGIDVQVREGDETKCYGCIAKLHPDCKGDNTTLDLTSEDPECPCECKPEDEIVPQDDLFVEPGTDTEYNCLECRKIKDNIDDDKLGDMQYSRGTDYSCVCPPAYSETAEAGTTLPEGYINPIFETYNATDATATCFSCKQTTAADPDGNRFNYVRKNDNHCGCPAEYNKDAADGTEMLSEKYIREGFEKYDSNVENCLACNHNSEGNFDYIINTTDYEHNYMHCVCPPEWSASLGADETGKKDGVQVSLPKGYVGADAGFRYDADSPTCRKPINNCTDIVDENGNTIYMAGIPEIDANGKTISWTCIKNPCAYAIEYANSDKPWIIVNHVNVLRRIGDNIADEDLNIDYPIDGNYCLIRNLEIKDNFNPLTQTDGFEGLLVSAQTGVAFDEKGKEIVECGIVNDGCDCSGTEGCVKVQKCELCFDNEIASADVNAGLFSIINGGKVVNVTMKTPGVSGAHYAGCFAGIAKGQSLLENVSCRITEGGISALDYTGGLVGYNEGTINHSYANIVDGIVSADKGAGGLVGNNHGTITLSYAENPHVGEIAGTTVSAGGLVGFNIEGNIKQSYAKNVSAIANNAGGLVGFNAAGNISECFARGVSRNMGIKNVSIMGHYSGGFVGRNMGGAISNCYANSVITVVDNIHENEYSLFYTGGFVGKSTSGRIVNSYAISTIDINGVNFEKQITDSKGNPKTIKGYVGGFVAENLGSSITNSYWAETSNNPLDAHVSKSVVEDNTSTIYRRFAADMLKAPSAPDAECRTKEEGCNDYIYNNWNFDEEGKHSDIWVFQCDKIPPTLKNLRKICGGGAAQSSYGCPLVCEDTVIGPDGKTDIGEPLVMNNDGVCVCPDDCDYLETWLDTEEGINSGFECDDDMLGKEPSENQSCLRYPCEYVVPFDAQHSFDEGKQPRKVYNGTTCVCPDEDSELMKAYLDKYTDLKYDGINTTYCVAKKDICEGNLVSGKPIIPEGCSYDNDSKILYKLIKTPNTRPIVTVSEAIFKCVYDKDTMSSGLVPEEKLSAMLSADNTFYFVQVRPKASGSSITSGVNICKNNAGTVTCKNVASPFVTLPEPAYGSLCTKKPQFEDDGTEGACHCPECSDDKSIDMFLNWGITTYDESYYCNASNPNECVSQCSAGKKWDSEAGKCVCDEAKVTLNPGEVFNPDSDTCKSATCPGNQVSDAPIVPKGMILVKRNTNNNLYWLVPNELLIKRNFADAKAYCEQNNMRLPLTEEFNYGANYVPFSINTELKDLISKVSTGNISYWTEGATSGAPGVKSSNDTQLSYGQSAVVDPNKLNYTICVQDPKYIKTDNNSCSCPSASEFHSTKPYLTDIHKIYKANATDASCMVSCDEDKHGITGIRTLFDLCKCGGTAEDYGDYIDENKNEVFNPDNFPDCKSTVCKGNQQSSDVIVPDGMKFYESTNNQYLVKKVRGQVNSVEDAEKLCKENGDMHFGQVTAVLANDIFKDSSVIYLMRNFGILNKTDDKPVYRCNSSGCTNSDDFNNIYGVLCTKKPQFKDNNNCKCVPCSEGNSEFISLMYSNWYGHDYDETYYCDANAKDYSCVSQCKAVQRFDTAHEAPKDASGNPILKINVNGECKCPPASKFEAYLALAANKDLEYDGTNLTSCLKKGCPTGTSWNDKKQICECPVGTRATYRDDDNNRYLYIEDGLYIYVNDKGDLASDSSETLENAQKKCQALNGDVPTKAQAEKIVKKFGYTFSDKRWTQTEISAGSDKVWVYASGKVETSYSKTKTSKYWCVADAAIEQIAKRENYSKLTCACWANAPADFNYGENGEQYYYDKNNYPSCKSECGQVGQNSEIHLVRGADATACVCPAKESMPTGYIDVSKNEYYDPTKTDSCKSTCPACERWSETGKYIKVNDNLYFFQNGTAHFRDSSIKANNNEYMSTATPSCPSGSTVATFNQLKTMFNASAITGMNSSTNYALNLSEGMYCFRNGSKVQRYRGYKGGAEIKCNGDLPVMCVRTTAPVGEGACVLDTSKEGCSCPATERWLVGSRQDVYRGNLVNSCDESKNTCYCKNYQPANTTTKIKCCYQGSRVQVDPLILDLNDDGIKLTDAQGGVMFDMSGTGQKSLVSWTVQGNTDDAFLCLPESGKVNSIYQLFGDLQSDSVSYENGFLHLASYDSNKDDVINKDDTIFPTLRLWIDTNKNAQVDTGELFTLEEKGVTEISLDYTKNGSKDAYGNENAFVSTFKRVIEGIGEVVRKVVDVILQVWDYLTGS